jgi:hypothetical protein
VKRAGVEIRDNVIGGPPGSKKFKTLFKGGVNPASGSLTAGSRVRIVHSPKKGIRTNKS